MPHSVATMDAETPQQSSAPAAEEMGADVNSGAAEPPKKKREAQKSTTSRLLLKAHPNEKEKLEANQCLLEMAARMDGAVAELVRCADLLSDGGSDNVEKREEARKNMQESVVPLMRIASRSLRDAGMSFAPFGGTHQLHDRNEVKRKQDVVDRTSEKSAELQLIDDFVERWMVEMPRPVNEKQATPQPQAKEAANEKMREQCDNVKNFSLPAPEDGGKVYTKSEAVRVAKQYPKGSQQRNWAMNAMIYRGYVPNTVRTIQKLLMQDEKGLPILNTPWIRRVADDDDATETIAIVRPRDGTQYTKSEALRCAKLYRKGSKERGMAVRAMISKGYAPANVRTIQRLCQMDEEGYQIIGEDWSGRPGKFLPPIKIEGKAARGAGVAAWGAPAARDMVEVTLRKRKREGGPDGREGSVEDFSESAAVASRNACETLESSDDANEPIEAAAKEATISGEARLANDKKTTPQPQKKHASKPKKEKHRDNVKNFSLPEPEGGGKVYTKTEAVSIAKQYPKGSQQRNWAMNAMIQRGYVPNTVRTLQRLLMLDEKGLPIENTPWIRVGADEDEKKEEYCDNVKNFSLPEPEGGGKVYTKSEAVRIAKQHPKGSQQRQWAMNAMIYRGYVPNTVRTIQKLLMQDEKGLPIENTPWIRVGADEDEKKEEYCDNVQNFSLPKPEGGGKVYTKSEAVRIAKQYPKGSQQRQWAMKAMIDRGYVPNTVRTIQRLLKQDEKGQAIVDTPWGNGGGRRALLTNDEVDEIIEKLKREGGRMYSKSDVERIIVNALKEKLVKEGKDPNEVEVSFDRSTLRNYETLFRSKLSSVYWKE